MARVRVAAVQYAAGQDVAANLATTLRMIDEAAAAGAQLIVLPEFCNHLSWYTDRQQAHEIATRPGDEFLTAVAQRAAQHGAYIKVNVTHAYPDGRTGGTNFLFDPAGEIIGSCDKQSLMGAENDHLDPGTEIGPVVDTPLGRLGMYACFEGVINEVTRGMALRGAQVLLNSLNSFALDEADLHIPVRAAENKVWVVAANKVGSLLPEEHLPAMSANLGVPPEWLHGAGESQIVAPDGTVVAKGPRTGEAVVIADIDPDAADDKRRPDGLDIFAGRRPELYGPIAAEPLGRRRPAGAAALPVAVVRTDDPAQTEKLVAAAAADGAQLLVLPAGDPESVARGLAGTDAYAVTTVDGGRTGVLVNAAGEQGRQRQLHSADGADELEIFELPWGALAIIAGEDSIYPETFRLAAIADADVVAVPFTPVEEWELSLGLPERAAENRLNVIAASPLGSPAAIYAMSPDFTLWTKWEGPFTGRISSPVTTTVPADAAVAHASVAPAQATNRNVSRRTDLVDGRPWRLLDALTTK
ncbi:nitrilase-related carbon-nitrogen hydrolase [Melissospora conviva]|uniref:nitrilase-related carbon-nitrogen hydrolase n=1 Tax=Melissospora conviva TaxID=3388432 RepID=UPI003B7ED61C